MSNRIGCHRLVLFASAFVLHVFSSPCVTAQEVVVDSASTKRVLSRADLSFRNAGKNRAGLDALGDSLVAIAVQSLSSGERTFGAANAAVMRLGIAGSDPSIDYRGAVPRLLKIALESPNAEVARGAVGALRSMTDTTAAVMAIERLATHPTHAFRATLSLCINYFGSDAGKAALRRLYANRNAIPDPLAREKLTEFVLGTELIRKP